MAVESSAGESLYNAAVQSVQRELCRVAQELAYGMITSGSEAELNPALSSWLPEQTEFALRLAGRNAKGERLIELPDDAELLRDLVRQDCQRALMLDGAARHASQTSVPGFADCYLPSFQERITALQDSIHTLQYLKSDSPESALSYWLTRLSHPATLAGSKDIDPTGTYLYLSGVRPEGRVQQSLLASTLAAYRAHHPGSNILTSSGSVKSHDETHTAVGL